MGTKTPQVGEIWKEVDPRFNRHVRILDVREGRRGILVQSSIKTDQGNWYAAPRSRKAWCDVERFNGKRGGYAYVQGDFA